MAQKAIGPSFAAELAALSGVIGAHFTWRADGTLEFFPDTPPAVVTAVQAAYAAHDPTKQDPVAVYTQKIASGCQIVSTATAALSATYPIDPASQGKMSAIAAGVGAGKGLPHGAATVQWPDVTGTFHSFGSADFLNLASAIEAYVYDLIMTESALLGGHPATWPATPITIA